MKRRVRNALCTAIAFLILCVVALMSGQEAVRRDKAQQELEKILDFAYGGLEYCGGEKIIDKTYAVFKDHCYTYHLDTGSNVLKSMTAQQLPEKKAVTREMLVRLIGHAQQDKNGSLPVRLVDSNGAVIVGDNLPDQYFALYRERTFLYEGTCKEALAWVQDGQISYLVAIQNDEDPPVGAGSTTRNQAVAAAFARAQQMADRGELQNPHPGTPFWDVLTTKQRIRMDDISVLTVTCALEIYDNAPYWKVTFDDVPVGKGMGKYSFYVDIFTGALVE